VSVKKKPEAPKVAVNPVAEPIKPASDFFDKLGRKAPLVVIGLIALICSAVFLDYLLFEKTYFFKDIGSDTCNLSYPYLGHVADYIKQFGVPKWSFNFGMGQSLFPFFLRDPFDILLYMAGKEHLYFGIVFKEVAKIIL
jgi:hypothetical protein